MTIGTFSPIAGSGARILYNAHGRSYGLPFQIPKQDLNKRKQEINMSKKQEGCAVFLAAFIIHVIIGLLIVKVGIQPVAETFGYELPTGATLVLVFWVQALAAGNVWQGYGKE